MKKEAIKVKLRQAAVLKAHGRTWGEVSEDLGVPRRTMNRYRKNNPDYWAQMFDKASREYILEDLEPSALEYRREVLERLKPLAMKHIDEAETPEDLDKHFLQLFNRIAFGLSQNAARRRKQVAKLEVEHHGVPDTDKELMDQTKALIEGKTAKYVDVEVVEHDGDVTKLPDSVEED